jgi:hypothetical protein
MILEKGKHTINNKSNMIEGGKFTLNISSQLGGKIHLNNHNLYSFRVPSSLRKWLKQWNSTAQQIFKTDYSKMKRWEAWLDWIVNKVTGLTMGTPLTICGALVPYPIENIREVAEVYNSSFFHSIDVVGE